MTLSDGDKKALIAEKMKEIMIALGLDLSDSSLSKTPARIANMYVDEMFAGLDPNHFPRLSFQEEEIPRELVLVKNISFISYCEHHFVPIVGKANVAYYPNKKIIGLSKIPRIVRYFAARPQLQERLTNQIADSLATHLETDHVAVSLRGSHFCTLTRGVADLTAEMETHVLKGCFHTNPTDRSEFFSRIAQQDDVSPLCPCL